jgi:tetratricopeptide (TPR) repeat protein
MSNLASSSPQISTRYEGLDPLGSGAVGSVYRAFDTVLRREVAVKILASRDALPDEVDYFKKEFRTVVDLKHPHLVEVFDFGETPSGNLFYSMEFLPGGTAASLETPVDPGVLLNAIVQLCRALQYIHSKGITHLDVKPDNVLIATVDSRGQPHLRLSDFGLASLPRASSETPVYGGTPAYAAPEVLAQAAVDSRADLFSLGVMAYELCTSRLPFSGQEPSGPGGRAPRPSALNTALSRDVDTLVLKLLEMDPANRYRDANAVIEAVNRLFRKKYALETEKTRTSYVLSPALVGREVEIGWIRRELAALAKVPFSMDDAAGETPGEAGRRQRNRRSAHRDAGREEMMGDEARMGEVRAPAPPRPTAGLILITGPTGIGKTRLVQDAKIFGQLNNIAFGVGRPAGDSLMPGAPVIEALRALMGSIPSDKRPAPGPELSKLIFPRDRGKPPEFTDPASFAESVFQLLRSSAAVKPLLFCIEDLQSADPLTVKTMGHLARGLFLTTLGEFSSETRCRIIVTLDDSGRVPGEIKSFVREIAQAPYTMQLPLNALTAEEVGRVVSSMFGPKVLPHGAAEKLHATTGGVPLFLQQLAAELLRRGAFRREHGKWKLDVSNLDDLPAPKGARQRAKEMLAGLSADQAKLIRVMSVLASPEDTQELSALAEVPYTAARKTLREMSERALIAQEKGKYHISDGPLRKSVYASIGWRKRRRMHLDAAAHLSAKPMPRRAKTHALAHHYLAAKDKERGLKWGLAAARDSTRAQANSEAATYYRQLLALKPDPDLRAELLIDYGQALAGMGDNDGAIGAYQEVLGMNAEAPDCLKGKVLRLAAEAYQEKGRYSQARHFFRRAISVKTSSPNDISLARARLAFLEHNAGKPVAAKKQIAAALDSARKPKVTAAVASQVYRIAGALLAERERADDAMPYLREALRHAVNAKDRASQSSTYTSLCWAYHRLAKYGLSRKAALAGLRIANRLYDPSAKAVQLLNLGGIYYRNGEYGAVTDLVLEASSLFKRAGTVRLYTLCLNNLGLAQIEMGQYEVAFQYLDRALSIQEEHGHELAALTSRSTKISGLLHTGQFEEAFELAARCAKQAEKANVSHDIYMIKKKLAVLYSLTERPLRARNLLIESLEGFTRIGEKDEICECLAALASLEEAAGNVESSASYAQRARNLAQAIKCKPIELMTLCSATPRASMDVRQIRRLASRVESPELRWRSHAACARYYMNKGDLPASLDEYAKCVAVYRSVAADMKNENLKKSYLAHPERKRTLEEIRSVKQGLI